MEKIKCNRCRVNLPISKFNKKRDDNYYKSCIECINYLALHRAKKCSHGKRKTYCIECGGKSMCKHNRSKANCIECKGNGICEHNKRKMNCKECGGSQICIHNNSKQSCKECGGVSICEHKINKRGCKKCNDPIKITINLMYSHSKEKDKKYNRYDADNFIDKPFLKELIKDYPTCYYTDCNIDLQYINYSDNLASIERLNNTIGHIKSNCVICCMKCNKMKKSNI